MTSDTSNTTHDLILRGGTIIDGAGAPGFVGDVAVANGRIVEVVAGTDGGINATAAREINAEGQLITPGFVDIHTHYDGQVCWDKQVTPSSWHGVTTIVMGNCGVGFAPVRPGNETALVELMESVEDIPGTALHEGIPWGWESFDQYLDAIDTPYTIDIGTQVPHVAVRHYVMGDRCYDDATVDDIATMASIRSSRPPVPDAPRPDEGPVPPAMPRPGSTVASAPIGDWPSPCTATPTGIDWSA